VRKSLEVKQYLVKANVQGGKAMDALTICLLSRTFQGEEPLDTGGLTRGQRETGHTQTDDKNNTTTMSAARLALVWASTDETRLAGRVCKGGQEKQGVA